MVRPPSGANLICFFSDNVAVHGRDRSKDVLSRTGHLVHFEPLTLLSALAVVTEHVGLTATVSTTYNAPFHLVRKFACEYEGRTLRENLGLPRPVNQFSPEAASKLVRVTG